MGCGGVVQVVFIVLKLLGLINWSWWWVMSPSLIGLAIVAVVLVVFLVVAASKA
jgi:ABC-type antimicrobial peptide transport system permease subunit